MTPILFELKSYLNCWWSSRCFENLYLPSNLCIPYIKSPDSLLSLFKRSFLLFNHLTIIAYIMHNIELPEIPKLHEKFWGVSLQACVQASWTTCLLQACLSLELLKLFHVLWALCSRPQRVYVECCTKSFALPRCSHFSNTLGLCQIFLNLPKALSTVILHFVRLFVWVFFPAAQIFKERFYQALEIDFRKVFHGSKTVTNVCAVCSFYTWEN